MANFEEAIPVVLENEGGYVSDPADPGGETHWGISKRAYPNLNITDLTKEQATEIYRRDFWRFDGIENQAVATKIFDAFVNMGHTAIKILQKLLGATVDGNYGPQTERLVNAEDPAQLLSRYRIVLAQHYIEIAEKNPAEAKFLQGWLKRARQ
jgi:lysozyme family protein